MIRSTPKPDNIHHPAFAGCISGKKGKGKTSLLMKLVKNHKTKDGRKAKHLFAFDPFGGFAARMGWTPCTTPEQLLEKVKRGLPAPYDCTEQFNWEDDEQKMEAVSFFCRWVCNIVPLIDGVSLFIMDEAQVVQANKSCPPPLNRIMDEMRRQEVDCYFVVNKGINKLHNSIRDQLTDLYVFQTTGRQPLKWLSDELTDEQLSEVRDLPIGKHLHVEI